jgi:GGDEF domain-containing protein
LWALGGDRFAVRAPGQEQLVTGLEEAQQAAHALAERLD